jgi:ATP-dependent DNA helicase PIF1
MALNEQQQRAFDLVLKEGKNVFITGSAGVGKSFLVHEIVRCAEEEYKKHVYVTALTGVAAANVNGMTLHSWAGIGLGKHMASKHAYYVKRIPDTLTRYLSCDILVIDEISMADFEYITKVSQVAQIVRRSNLPFGGIQVVLVGDFYQLAPVQKERKEPKYIFEDFIWEELIDETVHLTKVYRQSNDKFIDMLHKIRVGDVDDEIIKNITSTGSNVLENDLGIKPTILYCRNVDVDALNKKSLASLEGEAVEFKADDYYQSEDCRKVHEKNFTFPPSVTVKEGAQVMLLKNFDVENKLVNGSRGVVTKVEPDKGVEVLFLNGRTMYVPISTQEVRDNMNAPLQACRRQIPLKLAYAITIHKSQGLSIDYLEINLNGAFAPGQAYVALSRATNFDTMRVVGFTKKSVKTSEKVKKFYAMLKDPPKKRTKLEILMDKSKRTKLE